MNDLQNMRTWFQSGASRPYAWRKEQLEKLRTAILTHEKKITEALYADLKKSPEEAYGTETGLVLSEIGTLLRNLSKWMRPRRVPTNLVNLPSSSRIYRDPLGTILIIAPWNYPLQLALLPLAGALAGGNNAVIKPSELSPATAAVIEEIITRTFPPTIVRIVQGDGAAVIPALMQEFRFDHVFFTGSIPVGRAIYRLAAEQLIPVTLELGGKSPAVVEPDADLRIAARRIAFGKFTNAGQTCIAPDYLLVHASVKDAFLSQLKQTLLEFYTASPEESHDYGKIINDKRFDKLISYLPQGRIVAGGRHDRNRSFIEPTLLDTVDADAPIMHEEIFGPLLPIFYFETMEQALSLIRRNPDPLAFYLFTGDRTKESAWMSALRFGGGCINNTAWYFANHHLPFGGIGASGIGAYHGKNSFETFTHAKPVMRTPNYLDLALKYPPFKGKLHWFKRFLH